MQVELLELLADVDYNFIVYLESVGFTSASTMNHRFLGVSCYYVTHDVCYFGALNVIVSTNIMCI